MADANPFDAIGPDLAPPTPEPSVGFTPLAATPGTTDTTQPPASNPFDAIGPDVEPASSMFGSFGRAFERGVLPAVASLPAAGAGAEVGAAGGAAIGSAVPVVGTAVGGVVGGIVGGVAGAIGGASAVSSAQDWALSKLPDSWREAIGQDDRQQQLDQKLHSTASFLGGIAPYALTMRPGGFARGAAAENSTALQRIMTNPATARVFGGVAMGGMELGQEKLQGQDANWTNVAVATGFGLVFNKPTQLGESLMGFGGRAIRSPFEIPQAVPEGPTVAQAADAKVMGPGVTEDVYMGTHDQEPSAAMTAQEAARTETSVLGQPPEVDLHDAARRIDPETFSRYDELSQQREEFRNWIAEYNNPPPEEFEAAQQRTADLQAQLDAHVADQNGYTGGPEARRLRAQIRDSEAQHQELQDRQQAFSEGRAQETPDLQAARQHLMSVDYEMRDLAPQVSAAYRRAAEYAGTGIEPEAPTSEGETPTSAPATETVTTPEGEAPAPVGTPSPVDEQLAYIANDVTEKLVKAGRPQDEAEAAGQLLASRYQARSDRFGGALGTPRELYDAEGPEIKPGRARASKVTSKHEPPPKEGMVRVYHSGSPAADVNDGGRWVSTNRKYASDYRHDLPLHYLDIPETDPRVNNPDYADQGVKQGFTFNFETTPEEATRLKEIDRARAPELAQGVLGKINIGDTKPIITLMKDADASTFLHESGHQWLEEMMRDDAHPQAPGDLRADAATVRSWLGATEGEAIKTRQHEKFARGFEQYMREGVAPSPKLAGVFAQFRSWLMQVYQTIKSLGKPINEDIRNVMDRLLSNEPQRTVYAPDRDIPRTIQDIHEAEANEVEPHEAGATADRISAEKLRYITEQPPEVINELARTIDTTEAGPGNVGLSEVGEGGGEPGPVTEGGAGSAEHGSVKPGGNEAGAKGAGVRAGGGTAGKPTEANAVSGPEQRPVPREPSGDALAPTPSTVFGPDESSFLDKAGNIRVENLTTREDVARAIHDAADANNDFIGERRGVVTDGQVMDLADALGMTYEDLSSRNIGQAFNAEQVVAARKLLVQSATDVSAAMKKAATGTDEDVMAYAQAKDRHQMIQGQVAGITAEAGRALRAFRDISTAGVDDINAFMKTATGKTLYQLRREAKFGANLDTPGKVSKFLRDAQKRSFGRMILEYWINGLISGLTTHATYTVGNTTFAAMKAVPETAASALVGKIAETLGRPGERVRLGEVGAQLGGAARGLPGAIEAASEAFKEGVITQLPGETAHVSTPFEGDTSLHYGRTATNDPVTWHEATGAAYGIIRGLRDGLLSVASLAKGGEAGSPLFSLEYSPLGQIPDIAMRGVTIAPLGTLARGPGRLVGTIDSFFRSSVYSMEKNAEAYRMAVNEGLTGTARDARMADIRQNPSEELMERARKEATSVALMTKSGPFMTKVSNLINTEVNLPGLGKTPLLKFIDPFVRVAGNVLDQSLMRRTPLGFLSSELRADILGKNGNIAQDKAIGRMLVGTALGITFGALKAQNMATGSGPEDPRESAMWRLAGNQPYSVRIGDMWYSLKRLEPMSMLLGVSADLYDVADAAHEGDFVKAAAELHHAITQNVLDEGWMSGPAQLMQAIEDPGRYGEAYIRNFLSSFTPYSVGMSQITRATDPYTRQARTTVDAIRAKLPWTSQELMPRRDIWGEPMPSREALGPPGATAIYETQVNNDPVNIEMLKLGIYPSQPERQIRNVKLTDQQYDDYSRIAGRMTKMRLDAIVRSPDWNTWPDPSRRDVITESLRQSREAARNLVMMKYPQIPADAVKQKIAKKTGVPVQ